METNKTKCYFCGEPITEGYSAYPIGKKGDQCCKDCYVYTVVPILNIVEKCHSEDPAERAHGEKLFKIFLNNAVNWEDENELEDDD